MRFKFAVAIGLQLLLAAVLRGPAHADTLYAWGENAYGQVGDLTYVNRSSPILVTGLSNSVTATAGGNGIGEGYSLAIQGGSLYAWGSNGSSQTGTSYPLSQVGPNTALPVDGMSSGVTHIAAGRRHSLAMKDGALYAWGWNWGGHVGDGTFIDRLSPVPVSGLASGVTAIAAQGDASMALKNGAVYTWGENLYGGLGDGTFMNSATPTMVPLLSSNVTAIAGGAYHGLALKDGGVYAWGYNDQGQLGYPPTSPGGPPDPTPNLVAALIDGVTAIAAGGHHNLAIRNGEVYTWGDNVFGGLGDGTTLNRALPLPIPGLTNIVDIAAGFYSSYALSADGSLWTWGGNAFGQLGIGDTADHWEPVHLLPPSGYRFTSIEAGGYHALATVAPVPEPATSLLLALGGLAIVIHQLRARWRSTGRFRRTPSLEGARP